jgi:hypothetical protein
MSNPAQSPQGYTYTNNVALSATDSDVELVAARSGMSFYITDLVIAIPSAANVTIQDEDDTTYVGPVHTSAQQFSVPIHFITPVKVAVGKAVEFDKSAGDDTGTIFIGGFFDK